MVHPEPEHDHTAQPAAGKVHAKLCSLTRNHYIHRRRTGRAGDPGICLEIFAAIMAVTGLIFLRFLQVNSGYTIAWVLQKSKSLFAFYSWKLSQQKRGNWVLRLPWSNDRPSSSFPAKKTKTVEAATANAPRASTVSSPKPAPRENSAPYRPPPTYSITH